MKNILFTLFVVFISLSGYSQKIYVNINAIGAKNGTTWANAYTDLNTAIENATLSNVIYVAKGTYYPSNLSDRSKRFSLKTGVNIYGGFAGTEFDFSERTQNNQTILSGDIGTPNDNTDNSYIVVSAESVTANLDGFTIANAFNDSSRGGGARISFSNINFKNIIFKDNYSKTGAGIFTQSGFNNFFNCIFSKNKSEFGGGGVMSAKDSKNAFYNCLFLENVSLADTGAAVASTGDSVNLLFQNSTFYKNGADGNLGSIYSNNNCRTNVYNCIFNNENADPFVVDQTSFLRVTYTLTDAYYDGEGNISGQALFKDKLNPRGADSVFYTNDDGFNLSQLSPAFHSGNPFNTTFEDIIGNPRTTNGFVDMGAYQPIIERVNGGGIQLDKSVSCLGNDNEIRFFASGGRYPLHFYYSLNGQNTELAIFEDTLKVDISSLPVGNHTFSLDSISDADNTILNIDSQINVNINDNRILFVNTAATGLNDGTNWANAYKDLQSALKSNDCVSEIWIAKGTYKPTNNINRTISFVIPNYVKIYGGFLGNETNIDQRIKDSNETILSGNIGSLATFDNSFIVVKMIDCKSENNLIDGVTITNGNNNEIGEGNGGGISVINSTLTLENIKVNYNFSQGKGGGIIIYNSKLNIANSKVENNESFVGGGIYASDGNLQLINNIISHNVASFEGGGMALFGPTKIINNTIVENSALNGSGILFNTPSLSVFNSIIYFNSGSNQLKSIQNNFANVQFSNIENYNGGLNNINIDPLFTNSIELDFTLQVGSPCINSGLNSVLTTQKDILGNKRIGNKVVDMGAYEKIIRLTSGSIDANNGNVFCVNSPNASVTLSAQEGERPYTFYYRKDSIPFVETADINSSELNLTVATDIIGNYIFTLDSIKDANGDTLVVNRNAVITVSNPGTIYIDSLATGNNDGTSWAKAYTNLHDALLNSSCIDSIFVAKGTYYPSISNDPFQYFYITNNVKLYGGFPSGGGTFAQRDVIRFPTILSGNIGNEADSADNSYNVIVAQSAVNNSCVNGFYLKGTNPNYFGSFSPGMIYIDNNSALTISECDFSNAYGGNAIYSKESSPKIRDSKFKDIIISDSSNTRLAPAGYFSFCNNVEINNCEFSNNTGTSVGALAFINCQDVVIDSSSFTNNKISSIGELNAGAVVFSDCDNVNINKSIFTKNINELKLGLNSYNSNGGALYLFSNNNTTISDCVFDDNHAISKNEACGGAMFLISCINTTVKNSRFLNNTSEGNLGVTFGGALYSKQSNSLKIIGSDFSNNKATSMNAESDGGAIYINDMLGINRISNNVLTGNSCQGKGGALALEYIESISIDSNIFSANLSNNYGGALSIFSSIDVTASGNKFQENKANSFGGAMYAAMSQIKLTNNYFTKNKASQGGATYENYSNVNRRNESYIGNVAEDAGGAIFTTYGNNYMYQSILANNYSNNNGSAIYFLNSTNTIDQSTITGNNGQATIFNLSASSVFLDSVQSLIINNSVINSNTNAILTDIHNEENAYSILTNCNYGSKDSQTTANNSSSENPRFSNTSNIKGADSIMGTLDDGLRLANSSPLINAGNASMNVQNDTIDFAGEPRIQQQKIDIGVYEVDCRSLILVEMTTCKQYDFGGKVLTESGIYTDSLLNESGCDSIIILTLTINKNTTTTQTISACKSYLWPFNNKTYTVSGTYKDSIASAADCDSVVTLNLTIEDVNTAVSVTNNVIKALQADASYQWFNCFTSGLEIINGETAQDFSPSVSGAYACKIIYNDCADTTVCTNVIISSVNNNTQTLKINIFPNPNTGTFTLSTSTKGIFYITNALGKIIETLDLRTKNTIVVSNIEPGIYLVMSNEGLLNFKIVVTE